METSAPLDTLLSGLRQDVPLAPLSTWQVGGAARCFIEPGSIEEIQAALAWAQQNGLPWAVIGRGSNLLVADEGFAGLVIRLGNRFGACTMMGSRLTAQAGAPMAQAVMAGVQAGFGGIEPLVGVPGSIGGAVAMHASAHGVAISQGFHSGRVLRPDGTIETWALEDFAFSYRHSRLQDEPGIFLDGCWDLEAVDKAQAKAKVLELQQWRNQHQPTTFPSGGSTFRNPDGGQPAAGWLLEQVGAKGMVIGGAEVSERHANFILNRGGATAADINGLVMALQKRVFETHGIMLHPEVVGLGITVGLPL